MSEHSTLIGGSTAGRTIKCPLSMMLSQQVPKQTSSYAAEGSMLHDAIAEILNGNEKKIYPPKGGRQPFTMYGHKLTQPLVDEMITPALACFDDLVDKYGELDYVTEVRVEWDKKLKGCFGTADVVAWNEDHIIILDWKFGRNVFVSAEENPQLKFYAGAARATMTLQHLFEGRENVILAICQPAMDVPLTTYECSYEELIFFEEQLEIAIENAQADKPHCEQGDHCRFCPATAICPAMLQDVENVATNQPKAYTPKDLAYWLKYADQMTSWAKEIKNLAHKELEAGTRIKGWKLVDKRATRGWTDETVAERRLKGLKFKVDQMYTKKLITPPAAEKLFKATGKDFGKLDDLVTSKSSGTTLAPEDDKRPAVTMADGKNLNLPPAKK